MELLWESLINAFEHDRAAARGEMNPRALIVFKHDSHLGNARPLGQARSLRRRLQAHRLPRAQEPLQLTPPRRRRYFPPLHGGPAGGAITVSDASGQWEIRRCASEEDAEDAVYTALIKVCTSNSLNEYNNLAAVFMTAARNQAIDILRGRRCEPLDDETSVCLPHFPDEIRLESEIRAVDEALCRLNDLTQAALYYWAHGYTHREVATRLGITERKSRDLVGNGLKKLRREIRTLCR